MNEPLDDEIDVLLRRQFTGPIADEGFSARIMHSLPPRRRRIAWPIWLGIMMGVVVCWLSVGDSPLLQTGWSDWSSGVLSMQTIGMWLVMSALSLLALGWGLAEQ
jgi:hypothetical protein